MGNRVLISIAVLLVMVPRLVQSPGYSVRAIDATSRRVLKGLRMTLRYDCRASGAGINAKVHCEFITRKTGSDGIVYFPEVNSQTDIDAIYSQSITYEAVRTDVSERVIPGSETIAFRRLSFGEMLVLIFEGE
jgi:hypothetical protein